MDVTILSIPVGIDTFISIPVWYRLGIESSDTLSVLKENMQYHYKKVVRFSLKRTYFCKNQWKTDIFKSLFVKK